MFNEKLLILNTVSSCSTSWDGKQENLPSISSSNTDKDAADGGHQARESIQKLQAAGEGRMEGHYTPKITKKYKSKYNSRPHSPSPGQNQPVMVTITTQGWKRKKSTRKNINIALRSTTHPGQGDYLVFVLSPIFPVWADNRSLNPGGSPLFSIWIHSSLNVGLICRSYFSAGVLAERRGPACLRLFLLIPWALWCRWWSSDGSVLWDHLFMCL